MNIYTVHLDETYWCDPEVFRPERHLNADGTSVVKTDHFLPFGAGKPNLLCTLIKKNIGIIDNVLIA